MKDYYQILEVSHDTPHEDIKEQYRFLVQAWHPDKFPNPAQKLKAESKVKEINEAYAILGNAAKRAEYDSSHFSHPGHKQQNRKQTTKRQPNPVNSDKEAQWRKPPPNEQVKTRQQQVENLKKQVVALNHEINKLKNRKTIISDIHLITQLGAGAMFTLFYGMVLSIFLPFQYAVAIAALGAWVTMREIVKDRKIKSQKSAQEIQQKIDAMLTKQERLIQEINSL